MVTSIGRVRSPYWGHHITGKSRHATLRTRAQALTLGFLSETRLVQYRDRHDLHRRFGRSCGFPLSGCRLDGAGPVTEHPGRLPRRSHRARALAGRAQRADHAHLAGGPAGFHRLARTRGRPAALDRAPVVELPALLPLLHARGRHPRGSDRADRHAEDRPLAAALADGGGGRVAACPPPWSETRSATATAPCSRCCTPPACAFRSW